MSVQVKICGIKTVSALDAVLASGADYFGLVFYPPSPRSIEPSSARTLIDHAGGRAKAVALLVDPSDALLTSVLTVVQPDLVQLHGGETPDRVAAIRLMFGRPVIKAIKVGSAGDAEAAGAYGQADFILFDAKPPPDLPAPLPGGNGYAFDWRLLAGATRPGRFILSGGLDAGNVAAAIKETGASIVDVSSGVERAPGDKEPGLVHRFVAAAKAAAPGS